MPFFIIRQDITKMNVDCIVTAGGARAVPSTSGGVNGRIHRKAGPRLLAAIARLGGIRTGGAEITPAFELPCKFVIHTAGPRWRDGLHGEPLLLRACYREALQLAKRKGLESIAFPLISSGAYGYPKDKAVQEAIRAIREFLNEGAEMTVYLAVYDEEAFRISSGLFEKVEAFIDTHYVQERARQTVRNAPQAWEKAREARPSADEALFSAREDASFAPSPWWEADAEASPMPSASRDWGETLPAPSAYRAKEDTQPHQPPRERYRVEASTKMAAPMAAPSAKRVPSMADLEKRLTRLDEGFGEYLDRLMKERGMKPAECYKRANVDKKVYSKIHTTPGYTPKKTTAVAFAVALRLDMTQTRDLLSRAGYGLSRSNVFDVIVEFFITRAEYDVDRINQVLYDHDMPLLGSNAA